MFWYAYDVLMEILFNADYSHYFKKLTFYAIQSKNVSSMVLVLYCYVIIVKRNFVYELPS